MPVCSWCCPHTFWRVSPGGASGNEPACHCKRQRFDPWVGKIPWRREWLLNPVFLPGEPHGQRSLVGCDWRVGHGWSNLAHSTSALQPWLLSSFTQGDRSYLCLFQPPKSWRTPRRQQSRWGSQPSSFRSVEAASGGRAVDSELRRRRMLKASCRFRTSEVPCCVTTSSAGIVLSRAAGTRESSCSTHTPASTGDGGCRELQDGSGLLRVRPGCSDSGFCASPTSNVQS